jgi:putative transposase
MSYVRVYVHVVFSTKNREPFLNSHSLRKTVFRHIKETAAMKGIRMDCINGWKDHLHCLVSLQCEQSISKVVKDIKGESSHWINKNCLTESHFSWQTEYYAAGVSDSDLKRVRKYIYNQESHHLDSGFQIESDALFYPLAGD